MLCELSAPETVYLLDRPELIDNAERILNKFPSISLEVQDRILKYYQSKLHKDAWKKQLGAVHGFVKYLKVSVISWNLNIKPISDYTFYTLF